MSQWTNQDSAANSVLWAVAQYNRTANAANRNAFYGNTTQSAYVQNITVGQFGVDAAEVRNGNGTVHAIQITFAGSGYRANAAITPSGGNPTTPITATAVSNSTGRIASVTIANNGVNYSADPTITIAAPAAIAFNGNTSSVTVGNTTVNGWITLGANAVFLANGDRVTYTVGAGNTALGGLANNTNYFVVGANSTVIQLALTVGGSAINITSVPTSAQPGHSVTGQAAEGAAILSRGSDVVHAGWVVRTVGTGGRAGRVNYETLVAMGSMNGDGSDDTLFKD